MELQYQEDAQVNADLDDAGSFQAWLSIVTAVFCNIPDLSKETHFSLFHEFARRVYLEQHKKILEKSTEVSTSSVSTCHPITSKISTNPIEPLIRMCGNQLQRIKTVVETDLSKLSETNLKRSSLQEQLRIINHVCMSEADKDLEKSHLPSTDRGGMLFPRVELYPFLHKFDSLVQKEINFENFLKYGKNVFQVGYTFVLMKLATL